MNLYMKPTIAQAFKMSHVQMNPKVNNKNILDAFSALLQQQNKPQSHKQTNSIKSYSLLDMVEPSHQKIQIQKDDDQQFSINFRIRLKQDEEMQPKILNNQKEIKNNKQKVKINRKKLYNFEQIDDQDNSFQKNRLQQYYIQSQDLHKKQQNLQQLKFTIKLYQDTSILEQQFKQSKKAKKSTKQQPKISYHDQEDLQKKKHSQKSKTTQINSSEQNNKMSQMNFQQISFKIPIHQYESDQNVQAQPQNDAKSPSQIVQSVQQIEIKSPLAYIESSHTEEAPQVQIIKVTKTYPWLTGKASLKELVEEIYMRKLINQNIYTQFIQNHSCDDVKDYLQKFYSGRLHKFDFQKIKFTILDHRRFSELLINLFPGEYEIGKVKHLDKQASTFLNKLYQMTGEQYYKLYAKIDKISKIKWWSKILICQSQKLAANNKQKQLAQKKAEKAQLAVQQVLNEFRAKLPTPFTNKQNNQEEDIYNFGVKRGKRTKFN